MIKRRTAREVLLPQCWTDFPEDFTRCRMCGTDVQAYCDHNGFREKLLLDLNHSELLSRMRAVSILGRLREERAIEPLMALLGRTEDVWTAVSVVRTLGEFNRADVRAFLRTVTAHPERMVREEAWKALRALEA